MCLTEKCFVMYLFFFPPGVYVETLNLIASIPGPYILTIYFAYKQMLSRLDKADN